MSIFFIPTGFVVNSSVVVSSSRSTFMNLVSSGSNVSVPGKDPKIWI